MEFDACVHQIRRLAIRAGAEIRKAKGLPEEKNITIVYNEVAPLLGLSPDSLSSEEHGNHLPSPREIKRPGTNIPVVQQRDCLACGRKLSVSLQSLCVSCSDSENGKYHTMWYCGEMDQERNLKPNTGCGKKEKSEKFYVQWLDELVPDWQSVMKRDAGIKTVTDEGIK